MSVLYCQSPALFWCALALIVCFFVRRGAHRVRAVLDLVGAVNPLSKVLEQSELREPPRVFSFAAPEEWGCPAHFHYTAMDSVPGEIIQNSLRTFFETGTTAPVTRIPMTLREV